MYLTNMSHEELYIEERKDLVEISTRANMFIDRVRKNAKTMMPFPMAPQRMTITTSRKNIWTLVGVFNSLTSNVKISIYAPIIGKSCNGYIQMTGLKSRDIVMYYTAHFMQRYKERYIDHYQIDLKGKNLFEYFVHNNPHVLYTRCNNDGYFIVSDHGMAMADLDDDRRFMTHITFLGDDELTLKKKLIYEKEIAIYKGMHELIQLKTRKQKDDIITIWNIAKKHNAGFELVKRWYKWNKSAVPDDELHQYIDLIEKNNVKTIDRFLELVSTL